MARLIFLIAFFYSIGLYAAPEEDFLAARDAYNARDKDRVAQHAARLDGYILQPYATFWQFQLGIEDSPPEQIKNFINRYADLPFSERLRLDWLKHLGKTRQWETFLAEYDGRASEEVDLQCYAQEAMLSSKPKESAAAAKSIWLQSAELPATCLSLFDALHEQGLLASDDVWLRLRRMAELGNINNAKRYAQYLPGDARNDYLVWLGRALSKFPQELNHRAQREAFFFPLLRLAREDPHRANVYWGRSKSSFSERDQAYGWGQLATIAARKHDPIALTWFRAAEKVTLDDAQLAWKVRAALRALDWDVVLAAIADMTLAEQAKPAWQYWKGRALKTMGRPSEANESLVALSRQFNFYGQLASEELGTSIGNAPVTYRPLEEEISMIRALPAAQRALLLYRLDMRPEANREWAWLVKNLNDKQLLAAAELARRFDWIDRSIYTADKTVAMHDFGLRYPTPHRDLMQGAARQNQLDEAWIYGLIRQESRFMTHARSAVGASGLMQLMPATAVWIAKRIRFASFRPALVNQTDINVLLGSSYLKYVLDSNRGDAILATAAYNAGPQRAKKWQDTKPLEGAIYIENIPFTETREYVQKVMSNTIYYTARLALPVRSLKQRLGTIPAKGGALEDDVSTEATEQ